METTKGQLYLRAIEGQILLGEMGGNDETEGRTFLEFLQAGGDVMLQGKRWSAVLPTLLTACIVVDPEFMLKLLIGMKEQAAVFVNIPGVPEFVMGESPTLVVKAENEVTK